MTAIIDGTNGVTTPNVLTSSSGVALTLQSGGTTAVTIDTSQNVLVGMSSYGVTNAGASISPTASSSFYVAGGTALTIGRGASDGTAVQFNRSGTNIGTIAVSTTGLTMTGTNGITFTAAQTASSDANTLDDYEEGTWTPSVGGTATYSGQAGQYLKIGKFVFASFDLTINLIGTGSKSSITGLPFTAGSSSNTQAGTVTYWSDFAISTTSFYIRVDSGGTTITTASTTTTQITVTNTPNVLGNGTRLIATAIYTSNA